MVRPVGRTVYGDSETRLIRIRQLNSPKDEFIIPKEEEEEEKQLTKNCIKIDVFKQLSIPYN